MEGLPLHPAIVHLPIGIGFVLPFVILIVIWGQYRNCLSQKTWFLVVFLQFVIFASGIAALKSGENEEERVEKVVSEAWIELHEETAESVPIAAGMVFVVSLLAYLPKPQIKRLARFATFAGSCGMVYLLFQAGHTGGELAYTHGAARAYIQNADSATPSHTAGSQNPTDVDQDD